MKIGMGTLGAVMLFIGFSPNLDLKNFVGPTLSTFTLDPYAVNYLMKISFWHLGDLSAVALALLLGTGFFYLAQKTNVYRLQIPHWLGADFIGSLVGRLAILVWIIISFPFTVLQTVINRFSQFLYKQVFSLLQSVDYRPGQKAIFRSINISNIDFDMILVLLALSITLIVVFYIRFGLDVFRL